jgi:hypothetical protein
MIVAGPCRETNSGSGKSFFDAIAGRCQPGCEEYRLITQPDHAKLSGAIAAAFDRSHLPYVTDEIIAAIAGHDIGWLEIDGAAPRPVLPPYDRQGHLRSFLTTPPEIFLKAWTGSISHAEQIGPTAGMMVSRHFEQLAHFRLRSAEDSQDDVARLRAFLAQEGSRQQQLRKHSDETHASQSLELLQFCDLISLYLCCGVEAELEFPQQFGRGPAHIARRAGRTAVKGVPLRSEVKTQCPAYLWRPGSPALTQAPISVHILAIQ